jgi:hypothetical protein
MKKHHGSHPPVRRQPLGAAIALALTAGSTGATTTIIVGDRDDGTACSLMDAITAANTDRATGGCTAGNGKDIIELTANVTLTAVNNETDGANGLPSVTSIITLNGHGHTIARSSATDTPTFGCCTLPRVVT